RVRPDGPYGPSASCGSGSRFGSAWCFLTGRHGCSVCGSTVLTWRRRPRSVRGKRRVVPVRPLPRPPAPVLVRRAQVLPVVLVLRDQRDQATEQQCPEGRGDTER